MKFRGVAAAAALVLLSGLLTACLPDGTPAPSGTVFVSPSASSDNSGVSCGSAKFSSIQAGVNAAAAGHLVVVCAGTYFESVNVNKTLTLRGFDAVLDASAKNNGVIVTASNSTVRGLTVQNAIGEGILAASSSSVTIEDNLVKNNDRDATNPNTAYDECKAQGDVPGDCGEGIHLMGVASSTVTNNHVTGNAGGILLTDEVGPTHDNVISNNVVDHNALDCGITLPSHNTNALSGATRQPNVAGVYDNTISGNLISENGSQGEGAGVLLATPAPGTAVYDNTITHNWILNNGMPGVTVHAHAPGQDLDGNVVTSNAIGTNNLNGDPDASVPDTTGVLVFSAVVNISITISGNTIVSDHNGVWLSSNVTTTADPATSNTFNLVTNPVVAGP